MTIKEAIIKIHDEINEREKEITEYDQKVGDGDHALNLQRGFKKVVKSLDTVSNNSKEIFDYVGRTLMFEVGGTSGAIYGMAFIAGALSLEGAEWNFDSLMTMIKTAAERIEEAGGVKVGEKTLYDVWGQVSRDISKITDTEMLRKKIIEYRDSTINLAATKGRASYVGDRSKGVVDPGAVTSEIILRFLSETI